jgi:putative hydrolase of the HAD superfamily
MHIPNSSALKKSRALFFDWGGTLMREFPGSTGPMYLWPEVAALPGSVEALEALFPHWTIAIASNALASDESEIWAALQRVELAPWVDRIYCYRGTGYKKPAREFFEYILTDLHLEPMQCVMIGDDFQVDVQGANQAGIYGIWLNSHTRERRAGQLYRTIYGFPELSATLELLGAGQHETSKLERPLGIQR